MFTKNKALLFLFLLVSIPFVAVCQISTPQWVNGIGGTGSNSVPSGVISDNQNNIYITGTFQGTVDFDATASVKNLTSVGNFDVYVAKYTTAGALIWAVSVGGSGLDQESSNMAIAENGNITIGGLWDSPSMDADPGPGVFTLQNLGGLDGFVITLDKDGNFVWAKSIGASGGDIVHKIATDKQGNIIAIGQFQSTVTIGNLSVTASGNGATNGLTVKFDPAGNPLWAVNLGQSGYNETRGIAVDVNSEVIVSGVFNGNTNFNPLGTAFILNGGSSSIFLAKYNSSGILLWVKAVSGSIVNNNVFVCVDASNDVYLSGPFNSPLTFNTNNILNRAGTQDFFLAKYRADGTFTWVKGIGGTGATLYNYGIVVSKDNYLYCSGYMSGTADFNPSANVNSLVNTSGQDFFLAKYDVDGNYKFAFNAGNGSCNSTAGRNLAIDTNNDVLLVGSHCSSVNFSALACAPYPLVARSSRESFLAKYTQNISTSKITSFTLPQMISSVIDEAKLEINVTMPVGSNVTSLVPTVITNGGILSPLSGVARDFTNPVVYSLVTGCNSLNYLVKVSSSTSTAKTVTICSKASTILQGDNISSVPDSYLWEILVSGNWATAPVTADQKDYQTSGLTNSTTSNIVVSLRRKVTTSNIVVYDSFFDVTLQPTIGNNVIVASGPTNFCGPSDPLPITGNLASGGSGTNEYQWQSSTDNITFLNLAGTSRDFDPGTINSTTYYRRIVTSGTCDLSISNAITLQVGSISTPIVPSLLSTCPASSVTISVDNPQALFTYNWYTTMSGGTPIHTGPVFISPILSSNINYYVEAVAETCVSIRQLTAVHLITKLDAPVVNVKEVTEAVVTFSWLAIPGSTAYEVSIDNGQTYSVPSSGSSGLTHTVLGLKAGESVTLLVRVKGSVPCQLSDNSVPITGKTLGGEVLIPNTFTPNGDGNNDILFILHSGLKAIKWSIYTRWGEKVFQTQDINIGWDGKFNGSILPVGVYVYHFDAIMHDDGKVQRKGTITLLK